MERIFRIALIGAKEIRIEGAATAQEACRKLGWDPANCAWADITDEVILLNDIADPEILKAKTPNRQ